MTKYTHSDLASYRVPTSLASDENENFGSILLHCEQKFSTLKHQIIIWFSLSLATLSIHNMHCRVKLCFSTETCVRHRRDVEPAKTMKRKNSVFMSRFCTALHSKERPKPLLMMNSPRRRRLVGAILTCSIKKKHRKSR